MTARGVLVDADAEQAAGSARRASAAGRSGCAGRSAGRSRTSRTSPRPAASWVIRCLGVEPPVPKATMCEDWMLAPAQVPPTTTPRACAAMIASPNGGAVDDRGQLELVAAGHEDAGDVVEQADARRVLGLLAALRPRRRRPRRRRACGTARRTPRRSRGRARSGRDDGDPGVGAAGAGDELLEHGAPAELVLGTADRDERSGPGAALAGSASRALRPIRHAAQPTGCAE